MVITSKQVTQLFAYEDEEAKRILRNLKKVEIKIEYKLIDNGVKEYVSVPKLDQKAFRYIQKNGKLYLRESVTSVGGLVQESVLINLGDFTIGEDEVGAELEYLVRVKDAKAKQRMRQLQECERIAQQTLQKIQKQVKNDELLKTWQNELNESKRFVRLGKEDYYQSQVAIIAKFAKQDENLAKLLVEYDQKINDKNEKWLTQPLKLPKAKNAAERLQKTTETFTGLAVQMEASRKNLTAGFQTLEQLQKKLQASLTRLENRQGLKIASDLEKALNDVVSAAEQLKVQSSSMTEQSAEFVKLLTTQENASRVEDNTPSSEAVQ